MRNSLFIPRFLVLWLIFSLFLSNPAWALRQLNAGAEENPRLIHALRHATNPSPAAGAEETYQVDLSDKKHFRVESPLLPDELYEHSLDAVGDKTYLLVIHDVPRKISPTGVVRFLVRGDRVSREDWVSVLLEPHFEISDWSENIEPLRVRMLSNGWETYGQTGPYKNIDSHFPHLFYQDGQIVFNWRWKQPRPISVFPLIPQRARRNPARAAGAEERKIPAGEARLLIAEDEDMVRRLLLFYVIPALQDGEVPSSEQTDAVDKEITLKNGIRVGIFADAQKAVEWAKQNRPQMVLTDLNLINGLGFEVAEAAKTSDDSAVILLASPKEDQQDQVDQLLAEDKLDGFMPKPYRQSAVLEMVRAYFLDRIQSAGAEESYESTGDMPAMPAITPSLEVPSTDGEVWLLVTGINEYRLVKVEHDDISLLERNFRTIVRRQQNAIHYQVELNPSQWWSAVRAGDLELSDGSLKVARVEKGIKLSQSGKKGQGTAAILVKLKLVSVAEQEQEEEPDSQLYRVHPTQKYYMFGDWGGKSISTKDREFALIQAKNNRFYLVWLADHDMRVLPIHASQVLDLKNGSRNYSVPVPAKDADIWVDSAITDEDGVADLLKEEIRLIRGNSNLTLSWIGESKPSYTFMWLVPEAPAGAEESIDVRAWDYSELPAELRDGEEAVRLPAEGLWFPPEVVAGLGKRNVRFWFNLSKNLAVQMSSREVKLEWWNSLLVPPDVKIALFPELGKETVIAVGRAPAGQGYLPEDSMIISATNDISRVHLELRLRPDGSIVVRDRGTNGTYLQVRALSQIQNYFAELPLLEAGERASLIKENLEILNSQEFAGVVKTASMIPARGERLDIWRIRMEIAPDGRIIDYGSFDPIGRIEAYLAMSGDLKLKVGSVEGGRPVPAAFVETVAAYNAASAAGVEESEVDAVGARDVLLEGMKRDSYKEVIKTFVLSREVLNRRNEVIDLPRYLTSLFSAERLAEAGFELGRAQLIPPAVYNPDGDYPAAQLTEKVTVYVDDALGWAGQIRQQLENVPGIVVLKEQDAYQRAQVVVSNRDPRGRPGEQLLIQVSSAAAAKAVTRSLFDHLGLFASPEERLERGLAVPGGVILLHSGDWGEDIVLFA